MRGKLQQNLQPKRELKGRGMSKERSGIKEHRNQWGGHLLVVSATGRVLSRGSKIILGVRIGGKLKEML